MTVRTALCRALAFASVLVVVGRAEARDGVTLLTPYDRTFARAKDDDKERDDEKRRNQFTDRFASATSNGTWYLSVEADREVKARISLNGTEILGEDAFGGDDRAPVVIRRQVTVKPSNVLVVKTTGHRGSLRIHVDGIVKDSDVQPALVRHVYEANLLDETFTQGARRVTVTPPTTAGLFWLDVTRSSHAHDARITWNGVRIPTREGDRDEHEGREGHGEHHRDDEHGNDEHDDPCETFSVPVLLSPTNTLAVSVPAPGSSVRIRLRGFGVDTVAPTLDLAAPPTQTWIHLAGDLRVSYADSISQVDTATLQVLVNGVSVLDRLAVGASSASAPLSALYPPLHEGTNEVRLVVQDYGANVTVRTATILVDTQAPTLAATLAPSAGTFTNATPTVTVVLNDPLPGAGVSPGTFQALLDGQVTNAFSISASGGQGTLGPLAPGQHSLTLAVSDFAGTPSQKTLVFEVDAAPPSVTFSIAEGAFTSGMPQVTVQFADLGVGVAPATFRATLSSGLDVTNRFVVTATSATGDLGPLANGPVTLTVSLADHVANTTVRTLSLYADARSPVLTIDPNGGDVSTPSPTFVVSFSDPQPGAGLAPATFAATLDGQPIAFAVGATSAQATLGPLGRGEHLLSTRVRDLVGNEGVKSVVFAVVAVGPTLSVTPANGSTTNETIPAIVLSHADAGQGVNLASVTLKLDGAVLPPVGQNNAATAFLPAGPLSAGDHVIEATAADNQGAVSTLQTTFHVELAAARIVVSISPSDPSSVLVDSVNSLTLQVLTSSGLPAKTFASDVQITTTDGLATLDQLLVHFTQADQGVVVVRNLAIVRNPGTLTVTATALASPGVTGTLALVGVPAVPVVTVSSVGADGAATVVVQTVPNANVTVLVDGNAVATGTTDAQGRLSLVVTVGPGPHTLQVSAVGPDGASLGRSAVVADVGPPVSVTGLVLDGTQPAATSPLPGVSVTIEGTGAGATTDAQGRFAIPNVPLGSRVLVVNGSQTAGSFGLLRLNVSVTAPVAIPTIVLRPVNYAAGTPVVPDSTGNVPALVVTSPTVPNLVVEVPAGQIVLPPASRPVLTVTPVSFTDVPVPLPSGLASSIFVSIGPEGTLIPGGFKITFPNPDHVPPGQTTPVWRYAPETGKWEIAGNAVASADGATLLLDPFWTGIYSPQSPVGFQGRLVATVTDETGASLSGVLFSGTDLSGALEVSAGTYSLAFSLPETPRIVGVRATKTFPDGSVASVTGQLTLSGSQGSLTLRLAHPATVTGRVVAQRNNLPVRGAEVFCNGQRTTTAGVDGRFTLTNVPVFGPDPNVSTPFEVTATKFVGAQFTKTVTGTAVTGTYTYDVGDVAIDAQLVTNGASFTNTVVRTQTGDNSNLWLTTLVYSPTTQRFYCENEAGGDSILEITRNGSGSWPTVASGFGGGGLQRNNSALATTGPGAARIWVVEGSAGTVFLVNVDRSSGGFGLTSIVATNQNPTPGGLFPLVDSYPDGRLLVQLGSRWLEFSTDGTRTDHGTNAQYGESMTHDGQYFYSAYDGIWQVDVSGANPQMTRILNTASTPISMVLNPDTNDFYLVQYDFTVSGVGGSGSDVCAYRRSDNAVVPVYRAPPGKKVFSIAFAPTLDTNETALYVLQSDITEAPFSPSATVTAELVEVRCVGGWSQVYTPNRPDTDGDGLPDDLETAFGSSPTKTDTDADGFDDYRELVNMSSGPSNPADPDPSPAVAVVRSIPQGTATGVFQDTRVVVDFSEDMNVASLGNSLKLLDASSNPVVTTFTYVAGAPSRAILTPTATLTAGASYTISVSQGASAAWGANPTLPRNLGAPFTAKFTVGTELAAADDDADGILNVEEVRYGQNVSHADLCGTPHLNWLVLDPVTGQPTPPKTQPPVVPPPYNPQTGTPIISVTPVETLNVLTSTRPAAQLARELVAGETFAITLTNTGTGSTVPGTTNQDPVDRTHWSWVPVPPLLENNLAQGTSYVADFVFALDGIATATSQVTFTTASGGSDTVVPGSEVPHTEDTLALTQWEVFPVLEPTVKGSGCSCSCGGATGGGASYVVPRNGSLVSQVTDVTIPGASPAFEITRTNRSNQTTRSVFGALWFFNYDRQFVPNGADLEYVDSDGRHYTYPNTGDGVHWSASPGRYEKVQLLPSTYFGATLVQRMVHGGMRFYYAQFPGDATGAYRLTRLEDANGESIVFNRDATTGQLNTIVDTIGRTTTLLYYQTGDFKDGLLWTVTDHALRMWTYDYVDGVAGPSLWTVQTPAADWYGFDASGAVASTAVHGPRVTEYGYDPTGGWLTTVSVSDAQGGSVVPGEKSVRFTYGLKGEVQQVDYGTGTAFYNFDRANGTATQIDRAGNVLDVTHASDGSIRESVLHSRNLRSFDPTPEPDLRDQFVHDANFELIEHLKPRGNVERWVRDPVDGKVLQHLERTSKDPGAEFHMVEFDYEPDFKKIRRVTEERGHAEGTVIVTTAEETISEVGGIGTSTPRTYSVVDPIQRDAYSSYFFYDHENVSAEVLTANVAMGLSGPNRWQLTPRLKSYGRTTFTSVSAGYDSPDTTNVFKDEDQDGYRDRGGNLYHVRGPRPLTITNTSGTSWKHTGARQVIETRMSYNGDGHNLLVVTPDGRRTRRQWNEAPFDLVTNPGAGYLAFVESATSYQDTDYLDSDFVTGVPTNPAADTSPLNLNLKTVYEHDAQGNVMRVTDPAGHVTTMVMDAMNHVVETIGPAPFGYRRLRFFDARNNLIQEKIQNAVANDRNDNGVQDGVGEQDDLGFFTNVFRYNSVNELISSDVDATQPGAATRTGLVTVYQHDQKQRRIAVQEPEGNVHTTTFDERDLVVATTAGASDPLTAQTTRFKFDANGNLVRIYKDDGDLIPDLDVTFDLFDRPTRTTDALGEYTETVYDLANHAIETKRFGRLTGAAAETPTTLLAHGFRQVDEAGRVFQADAEFFKGAGGRLNGGVLDPPVVFPFNPAAGYVRSLTLYRADDKIDRVVDDNGHVTSLEYDRLDRNYLVTDALGSTLERVFDNDSMVIRTIETELASDHLTNPSRVPEVFSTEYLYDEAHRLTLRVQQLGTTHRWLYDSRNNVLQASDGMGGPTGVTLGTLRAGVPVVTAGLDLNARGNTTRFVYDGASRLLQTLRDLRADGTGGSAVTQSILTRNVWDLNSRLAQQIDGNSNVTDYCYDHQNRLIRTTFANGTRRQLTWVDNQTGNRVSTLKLDVDARNVVKAYSYDRKHRQTGLVVTNNAPGVGQMTFTSWQWDGMDRLTLAQDDDSRVAFAYDSLSNRIASEQGVQTSGGFKSWRVTSSFDGVGNRGQLDYPQLDLGGGSFAAPAISLAQTFDEVNRLATISDGGPTPIAKYVHVGMGGRRLSRDLGNGTTTAQQYDGNRRVVVHEHYPTGAPGSTFKRFEYTWNRADNRTTENEATRGLGNYYAYDSAYRLTRDRRNVPSASLTSIANNTPGAPDPGLGMLTEYDLDPANNRRTVKTNGLVTEAYAQSTTKTWTPAGGTLPPPEAILADSDMNQYTSVTTSAGVLSVSYDRAGNQISGNETGEQRFFDCHDRLVQLTNQAQNRDVRYKYDPLGRRVAKEIRDLASAIIKEIVYVSSGADELEEWSLGGASADKRFVYGSRIDEPLRVTLRDSADVNNNGNTSEFVNLWFHDNSIGSISAISNDVGVVVESYRYKAYGDLAEILDKNGLSVSLTQIGNPLLFQGRRLDFEEVANLYYFRARHYSPSLGRFLSPDPKGVWGDAGQLGNAQSAFGCNPANRIDPLGRETKITVEGDTVVVSTDIYLWPGEFDFEGMKSKIEGAIEKIWNRGGKLLERCGKKIKFKPNVLRGGEFIGKDLPAKAKAERKKLGKGANVDLARTSRGAESQGQATGGGGDPRAGHEMDLTLTGGEEDEYTIAHEYGHLLGLDERYVTTGTKDKSGNDLAQPMEGETGAIMGYTPKVLRNPDVPAEKKKGWKATERDVDEFLAKYFKIKGTGPMQDRWICDDDRKKIQGEIEKLSKAKK